MTFCARNFHTPILLSYKKELPSGALHAGLEQNLIFVGLIAMMDSPRLEARAAIETCKKAGIRTVMITGDHKETAIAIARARADLAAAPEVLAEGASCGPEGC